MKKRMIPAVLLAVTLSLNAVTAPSAWAESDEKSAETLAAEGLDKLMKALGLFVDSLPLYEAPEILPNGDIIIRKIQPKEDDEKDTDSDKPSTDT